jgi:hypothetical protein
LTRRQVRPAETTITGRRRLGGKDIRDIHRVLAELEQLELNATVNPA